MDNVFQLEPLFCKNTGAYLASVADFCSKKNFANSKYEITKANPPKLLDQFVWINNESLQLKIKLHKNAELRENVRSILKKNNILTNLIVNTEAGYFFELDNFPKQATNEFVSWESFHSLRHSYFSIICMIRHNFFEVADLKNLYHTNHTYFYRLEDCCELIKLNHQFILRNRFSGFKLLVNRELFELLDNKKQFNLNFIDSNDNQFFLNLCSWGILRQIDGS